MTNIYVTQFGGFWRLTRVEWLTLVRAMIAGQDGYDLAAYPQLQRRPSFIHPNTEGRGYWISHPEHRLVQPLDWDLDDWRDALLHR
jgi:hypothetical protein